MKLTVLVVVALASACTPSFPALRAASKDVDSASTRSLVAAWAECVHAHVGVELGLSCFAVNEELRRRRHRRIADEYDALFPALTTSCPRAVAAVATAERVVGPIVLRDGTIPPWSELAIAEYPSQYYPDELDAEHLGEHATALLRCGENVALGRLFALIDHEAEAPRYADASPPLTSDILAKELAEQYSRAAFAMVDRRAAPPALAKALANVPRPEACPRSTAEVLALFHAPSAIGRIRGCECAGELPVEARLEAGRERERLSREDPETVVFTGPTRDSPSYDHFPPVVGPLVIVPLFIGALRSGHASSTTYPVREACTRAAPMTPGEP